MKKIAKAVFTLSAFTFVERVIGFFFKIFLSRKLGAQSMGVYQVAFAFFMVLLTFTTSGLPLIVSKMTAKCRAENNLCVEGSISTAALIVSIIMSLSTICVILIFNRLIGLLFADDNSRIMLLFMLPSLFFSAIYSSLRGNLWGRQKYTIVSVLELSEQIARIGACILLFSLGFNKLRSVAISLSIGCAFAATVCAICYFATGARLNNPRGRIVPLIKSSTPITAARAATSTTTSLIAIVAPFLLGLAGKNTNRAMYEFGYSMGMAIPLLYIPLTVVGSLAFVMIPTLSQAVASGNRAGANRQISGALKMSLVAGILFFPLFFALGQPLGGFIYGNADAGAYLKFAAWLLVPISLENITSSMMNSLDMEMRGLGHYLIGSAVMFAVFFISGRNFSVELMSIGMGVSFLLSSALNLVAMRKKSGIDFGFLIPGAGAAVLALPTVFLIKWLYGILGGHVFMRIAVSGSVGFVFMVTACFLFGILRMDFFATRGDNAKRKDKGQDKGKGKYRKAVKPVSVVK